MRYVLLVSASEFTEAGVMPDRNYETAKLDFTKALAMKGALLGFEKLQPSTAGVRIRYGTDGTEPILQAGPFPVDPSLLAEYIVFEADSDAEALEMALRMPVEAGRGVRAAELRKLEDAAEERKQPMAMMLESDLAEQLEMLNKTDHRSNGI